MLKVIGQGCRVEGKNPADWLVVETPIGKIVYKQFWTGPGIAVDCEVSCDKQVDEDELLEFCDDVGDWFNDANPTIKEPKHIGPVVSF